MDKWRVKSWWKPTSPNQDGTGAGAYTRYRDCAGPDDAHRYAQDQVELKGAHFATVLPPRFSA